MQAIRPLLPALLAGTIGAAILTVLKVPAGGIVGAVLGSAAVAIGRDRPLDLRGLRAIGLFLLGVASALSLERDAIDLLGRIALPLLAVLAALFALNFLLAWILHRRFGIDPVTALLATTPGGVSEIASLADQEDARTTIVLAIHIVRVIVVVLVALPILVAMIGRG